MRAPFDRHEEQWSWLLGRLDAVSGVGRTAELGSSFTRTDSDSGSFPFPLSFFFPFELPFDGATSCMEGNEFERDKGASSSPVADPEGPASNAIGCEPEPEAFSLLDVGSVASVMAV